jgi:hypothetical protein
MDVDREYGSTLFTAHHPVLMIMDRALPYTPI